MYLSRYRFDGDPTALEAAYRRLMTSLGTDSVELHVALVREDGLDLYDACPDRATFERFHISEEFLAALESAGLPHPTVTGLGDIVNVIDSVEALHP
jgi:hypothetical protein